MSRPARTSGAARLIIDASKPSKNVAVESRTNRKPWYGVTRVDSSELAAGADTRAVQRRGCRGGRWRLAGGRQPPRWRVATERGSVARISSARRDGMASSGGRILPRARAIQALVARIEDGDWKALRFERIASVLRIVIAHPTLPQNRIDGLLHAELARLFRELRREDEARALVLTGERGAFSAGGDFGWFPSLDDLAKLDHLRRDAKQMIWDLLDVELPMVAAVNGPAVGLGASLALLCDVIFMADTATIADPHLPPPTLPRARRPPLSPPL